MASLILAIIYLCFVSLGLPDSLLGSAWPTMYLELSAPLSYAGVVSMLISACTIISSLLSDRLTRKFSMIVVVVASIGISALGLLGFALAKNFITLLFVAIPFGLGAGGIDACLNNYVATHYKSSHISWLHCMWGVGAFISPYIMGYALTYKQSWQTGYLIVFAIQAVLCVLVAMSFPIWKKKSIEDNDTNKGKPMTFKEIFKTKGALLCFMMFLFYCGIETVNFLWDSSYLNLGLNVSKEVSANLACLFYGGMTIGRFVSGFIAIKLDDRKMLSVGMATMCVGTILVLAFHNVIVVCIGLVILGIGSGPIYPSIIHMTPLIFTKEKSQAIIGMEMAFAYVGNIIFPSLFGIIANNISIRLFPIYVSILVVLVIVFYVLLRKKTEVK